MSSSKDETGLLDAIVTGGGLRLLLWSCESVSEESRIARGRRAMFKIGVPLPLPFQGQLGRHLPAMLHRISVFHVAAVLLLALQAALE